MKNIILSLAVIVLVSGCGKKAKVEKPAKVIKKESWELPKLPKEDETNIRKMFPGAMRTCEFEAIILHYLNVKYQIPRGKVLVGISTCVDDIIYTKNFHSNPNIKGLFHLGGLAGLPFTGVSGLGALSHHVPEGGTLLLLLEPHIGYSREMGWGYIRRYDQTHPTNCCGALMGTLKKLEENKLDGKIREEDYQAGKVAEVALKNKEEILNAESPIYAFTRIISKEAERQVREHVMEIDMEHINYIVILGGILINTDYTYSDYEVIRHITIYDVRKKSFQEEILIPDQVVSPR